MPAKKVNHQGSNSEIENVIGGGQGASHEERKDDDLKGIGSDGQQHGFLELRTWGDRDVVLGHGKGLVASVNSTGAGPLRHRSFVRLSSDKRNYGQHDLRGMN